MRRFYYKMRRLFRNELVQYIRKNSPSQFILEKMSIFWVVPHSIKKVKARNA